MKYLFSCFLFIVLFASCTQNKKATYVASENNSATFHFTAGEFTPAANEPPVQTQLPYESAVGMYTGMFEAVVFDDTKNYMYANKITISIDSIKNTSIWGHSIVAGNNRPFSGSIHEGNVALLVEAKEPGDDKYDGVFTFSVSGDFITVEGVWEANDKNLPVTKRTYTLERREFTYDPALELPEDVQWDAMYGTFNDDTNVGEKLTADVFKYNASTTKLKGKNIANMYKADLEVMRNAIYARHGYSFKNRRMRYVFDTYVDWYMPVSTDITAELTQLEKDNIELLKRYEAHAEKYYDSFGR